MITRRRLLGFGLMLAVAPARAAGLRPFGLGSFEEIRRANAGRAHVVAFWSVTCAPCHEEMPVWRELRRRRPDVPLALVSTDGLPEAAGVEARLAEHGLADAPAWIFADERVERLRHSIDRGWRGELPRTYLVDARGGTEALTGRVQWHALADWLARAPAR